tara:strand:- start:917 stop:1732 length:816 start_codon:yes stop_codon:yes gene_type:complete
MKNCPECQSPDIQQLGDNFFCYDCDWSDLKPIEESSKSKDKISIYKEGENQTTLGEICIHYRAIYDNISDEEVLQLAETEGFTTSGISENDIILNDQDEIINVVSSGNQNEWTSHRFEFDNNAGWIPIEWTERFPPNPDRISGINAVGDEVIDRFMNGSNPEEQTESTEPSNWQGLRATTVIVDDVTETLDAENAREALDALNQVRDEAECNDDNSDDQPSVLNDIYDSMGIIGLQLVCQLESLINKRDNTSNYHNNSREHQDSETDNETI